MEICSQPLSDRAAKYYQLEELTHPTDQFAEPLREWVNPSFQPRVLPSYPLIQLLADRYSPLRSHDGVCTDHGLFVGGCGLNGDYCTTVEATLDNVGSSADITLIPE